VCVEEKEFECVKESICESERERKKKRDSERERKRESVCACVRKKEEIIVFPLNIIDADNVPRVSKSRREISPLSFFRTHFEC